MNGALGAGSLCGRPDHIHHLGLDRIHQIGEGLPEHKGGPLTLQVILSDGRTLTVGTS